MSTDYTAKIKTWTDYTYDLGIFEGCWRVIGDAIYENDIPFRALNIPQKERYDILSMFHSIYSLIAQVNANLIKGINQMSATPPQAVSIEIEPYVIPVDSWPMPPQNPSTSDAKPSVIKDLWNVIDPVIGKFLIAYNNDPLMKEVLTALQEKGKELVDTINNIIYSPKKSS